MALAPSFYNQRSVLSINIMIVDDDPIFLKTFSSMLEKFKYRDPSVMEIKVIAEKGPIEALSTLKIQRNNIDLIITDYYMLVMNGLQLINQINQEFGNLPILVISADKDKEEESLSYGALSFFSKPIKETDLPRIYQFALTYKRNGKSIMSSTELNHKDTQKHIKLLPDEQAHVFKTKKKYYDQRKPQKRNLNGGPSDDCESETPKKAKFIWTDDRHNLFVKALKHIGHDNAVPKKILEVMNLPDLTTKIIASHLQKYRNRLSKQVVEPFCTNSEYSFAQSKTPEPVRFSQMRYMNRSSNYDLYSLRSGSNFTLPIQSNPFQNVERRSFSEPFVMDNMMDQTSQGFGFGLLGPTGNNFNNEMMSSYGSFASNLPGSSHSSYEIQSLFNNENTSCNPLLHASTTTQPNHELPPLDNLDLYSDLDQQQQGLEDASTKLDLSQDFWTELDQILSLEDLDWTFNHNHYNGEASNTVYTTETNPPTFNVNPNQNQEQDDVSGFDLWSSLDSLELYGGDFMKSPFTYMN